MSAPSCITSIIIMGLSLLLLPLAASLSHQAPLTDNRINNNNQLSINVPEQAPDAASDVVDRTYPAFAMSMHSFPEYAGNLSSPNLFSRNLINTIAQKTGSNVHIRVGGTSGDFAVYNPDQEAALTLPPGAVPGGIPRGMRKGRAYFEGFATFENVKWTYMAHLANDSDGMLANSVADVQAALNYIGNNLEVLEIGNEINFYPGDNRPPSYTVPDYIDQWIQYEAAITQAVGEKQYQAPVFASSNFPWSIQNAFDNGQDSKGNVVSASLHPYMTGQNLPASARQSVFMNHTNIANVLDVFKTPVAWLKNNRPNIKLHLGEVNSDTYSMNNEELIGVFGSSLWLADFMLYAATLNVARMNVQQSTGFAYTSWRGTDYYGKPAAVLPPYYAHPFVADIIGNSGDIRIFNIDLGRDLFSAYAVYDAQSSKVTKIVLINFEDWSPDQGRAPFQEVSINIGRDQSYGGWQAANSETNDWRPPFGYPWHNTVLVQKLTAPGASTQDASQITWADQSWTKQSNGIAFQNGRTTQRVRGSRGRINVSVRASEAVLLTL